MTQQRLLFRYGVDSALELEFPAGMRVQEFSVSGQDRILDVSRAVADALNDPLGFPPLSQAIVPGDHVVLAVQREVPRVAEVVAGALRAVTEAGVGPGEITVLLSAAPHTACDAAFELPADAWAEPRPRVVVHDPENQDSLSYLAASRDNRPILINRRLFDAGQIIPISCARAAASPGYAGLHDGLFPTFSDSATIRRFRMPTDGHSSVHHRLHRQASEEAAWLLGINLTLQVVSGPHRSISHVLAGHPQEVAHRLREVCDARWTHSLTQQTGLVIASISGGPFEETWESFARALVAADRAVEDGGAVLICTSLGGSLGPGLRRLAGAHDPIEEIRSIRRQRCQDASVAVALANLSQRADVYLLSELPMDAVEALGIGYIDRPAAVKRLMRQFDSCTLISDAHRIIFSSGDSNAF